MQTISRENDVWIFPSFALWFVWVLNFVQGWYFSTHVWMLLLILGLEKRYVTGEVVRSLPRCPILLRSKSMISGTTWIQFLSWHYCSLFACLQHCCICIDIRRVSGLSRLEYWIFLWLVAWRLLNEMELFFLQVPLNDDSSIRRNSDC
jgi:hypothetical protein